MDNKSRNIQRVIYFILLIVIIIALKYLLYFISVPLSKEILFIAFLVLSAGYIFASSVLIPMQYKRTVYYIDDRFIFIRKGFFVYSDKYINIKNIRYVLSISIPVLDKMGCCFLVAGGCGVRTALTFISQNDSKEISEFVRDTISRNNSCKGGSLL